MSQLDVFVSHLRGRAAVLHAIVPVVAMGAGPLVFGILSDAYGLRSAWLYTMPALLVAAGVTLLNLRSYPGDVAAARSESLRQSRLEHLRLPPAPAQTSVVDRLLRHYVGNRAVGWAYSKVR